tara:strand:- start:29416 stop:30303 length:888 start_codon:yes stop_codon:yes gene_type:complete
MRKALLLTITLFIGLYALSQKNKSVELNWKIKDGDTLTYLTVMKEIDTSVFKFEMKNIFGVLNDSTNDKNEDASQYFKKINQAYQNIDLITALTSSQEGIVDITMKMRPKEELDTTELDSNDKKINEVLARARSLNQGISLRGSVYSDGNIHSFWLKSSQKNLVAFFFQLPPYPVQVGDSWSLDVNFIANGAGFICDSSHRANEVTLTEIKKIKGEKIAVVKYNLEEYVQGTFNISFMPGPSKPNETTMHFTHQAVAEFSIDNGKWISYNGILGLNTTGYMNSNSSKNFSLIEEK